MSTPDQRRERASEFEGRPLARPDDEIVDQGLGFDIGTLLSRRRVLALLGIGTASIGTAGVGLARYATVAASTPPSSTSTATEEIPDETAGPYPGDGSNGPDVLEQSGVVRSDIRSSLGDASGTAEGVPLTLELIVSDLANGVPFEGVAVYVWHCDRDGNYSMYSEGVTEENYLRGVQIADADGQVQFTTIFPACYSGRWPHIHFEVYPDEASITDATTAIATSQVALPADVCATVFAESGYEQSVTNMSQIALETDNVFGDDGGVTQLATVTGDVSNGYAASLSVGVDTTTTPTGGGMAGGQGSAPPGGTGGPPSTTSS